MHHETTNGLKNSLWLIRDRRIFGISDDVFSRPPSFFQEAKDLLIVDWSSSAEKAKVVKDDDCGTEIDLQIEEVSE